MIWLLALLPIAVAWHKRKPQDHEKQNASCRDSTSCPGSSTTLQRVFLPSEYADVGGRALDGSMAIYYYAPPADPTVTDWVIYLGATGVACKSKGECVKAIESRRNTTHPSTGSTLPTTDSASRYPGRGILSNGPDNDFRAFHKVFKPSLTSDGHTGARTRPHPEWGVYFSGHGNLACMIDHLNRSNHSIGRATRILLAGGSGGGHGALRNADWLAGLLPRATVSVAAVAGLPYPGETADHPNEPWMPPATWQEWSSGAPARSIQREHVGMAKMHRAFMSPSCVRAQRAGEEWRCQYIVETYKHVQSRALMIVNLDDRYMLLHVLGMPKTTVNETTRAYVNYLGDATRRTLNGSGSVRRPPTDAVFAVACNSHMEGVSLLAPPEQPRTLVYNKLPRNASTEVITSHAMLSDWFFGLDKLPHFIVEPPREHACDPRPCPSVGGRYRHCAGNDALIRAANRRKRAARLRARRANATSAKRHNHTHTGSVDCGGHGAPLCKLCPSPPKPFRQCNASGGCGAAWCGGACKWDAAASIVGVCAKRKPQVRTRTIEALVRL